MKLNRRPRRKPSSSRSTRCGRGTRPGRSGGIWSLVLSRDVLIVEPNRSGTRTIWSGMVMSTLTVAVWPSLPNGTSTPAGEC